MDGETLQLISLACYVNARLQGKAVPRFFPHNSSCTFCDSIRFVRPRIGGASTGDDSLDIVCDIPDEWFEWVSSSGYAYACLGHVDSGNQKLPDRISAAFAGGGERWLLGTVRDRKVDWWESGWHVWNPKAPVSRIWRVDYALVGERFAFPGLPKSDLSARCKEMRSTLTLIEQFARTQGLNFFADLFKKGCEILDSDDPLSGVFHKDVDPAGLLSLEAQRLLAACQSAWVFGGMGSWNDVYVEDRYKHEYESLSENLFRLLNRVACEAANDSARLLHW